MSRVGARAQLARSGATDYGLLDVLLNQAEARKQAMRARDEYGIGARRAGLNLENEMFQNRLGLQNQMFEGRLGARGDMFNQNYDFARHRMSQMTPSNTELWASALLPVASSGLMAYMDRRNMNQYMNKMRSLYAENKIDMMADSLNDRLQYGLSRGSIPTNSLSQGFYNRRQPGYGGMQFRTGGF